MPEKGAIFMNRFFGQNNPLWNGMETVFDVCALNLLWLLCCLPVFTIGPSTTAFFYAQLALVRGEGSYVSKDFFRSFKQNFKQGILLGLPLTAAGAFLALDVFMCYRSGKGVYTFFMVFFAVMFLLWAFITLYAFPLLSKFEKSNKEILPWAFVLSIRHLGKTLLMLIVLTVGLWICHILPGLIFIMFGLVGRFQAAMIASILKPYLPEPGVQEFAPLSFSGEEARVTGGNIHEKEEK